MTDRATRNAHSIDIHAHAVLADSWAPPDGHGQRLATPNRVRPVRVGDYRLDGVRYEWPFMEAEVRPNMDAAASTFRCSPRTP